MTGTMMPKPKKPLKDPNAKSPIQKFFGGKIPHYLAVVAFLYVLVDGGGSFLNRNAEQKARESIEKYANKYIDEQIRLRFPPISGPVLRNENQQKQWVDFIDPDKKNGNS